MHELNEIFSKDGIYEIAEVFIKLTNEFAVNVNLDRRYISISMHALLNALSDSSKDINALVSRRNHTDISIGKIAGIVTFRLVRWSPIQLSRILLENPRALRLNALVPFALCLKYFLNVDMRFVHPIVTKEFQYTLLRRHTNQETLGLVYDMIDFYTQRS